MQENNPVFMDIEVLIPTHHKTLDQALEIVKQSKATGHVLVCNQTDENKRTSIGDIEVACFNDIGVSKNRNHLIDNATGDICVCIDDDCSLVPDYINKVQTFFNEHPDVEFVLFNGIVTKENNRLVHNKKTKRVRSFSSIAYGGGPGLVFKRDAIYRYGLRYREDLGYPNEIYIGEDSAFLKLAVDSKAVVYRSSEVLFSIDGDVDNSIYFNGVDDRFLVSKGYVIKLVHPKLTLLFIWRAAWKIRKWRGNKKGVLTLIRAMKKGAAKTNKTANHSI